MSNTQANTNTLNAIEQAAEISASSVTVKHQTKTFEKLIGNKIYICIVRYDDKCRNGHNSFSITGEVWEKTRKRNGEIHDIKELKIDGKWVMFELKMGGCIHNVIERRFPEFKHLIKWHSMKSNQPMYYVENTIYHARNCNMIAAKECAVEQDDENLTIEQLQDKDFLQSRLPMLLSRFKHNMLGFGFEW